MALHDDLLEQAHHLASREPRKPRQASLRRAVSSAYYALYHLLVHEAALKIGPPKPTGLRHRIRRAFAHADMKDVCKQFAQGNVQNLAGATQGLIAPPVQQELSAVAGAFVELQEERHRADYDLSTPLIRVDVLQQIRTASQAFADWRKIRNSENARVFLTAILLQKKWSR